MSEIRPLEVHRMVHIPGGLTARFIATISSKRLLQKLELVMYMIPIALMADTIL
jgi:hypothetical protein